MSPASLSEQVQRRHVLRTQRVRSPCLRVPASPVYFFARTMNSGWPNSTGWAFCTSTFSTVPATSALISLNTFIASMMHTTLSRFPVRVDADDRAPEFGLILAPNDGTGQAVGVVFEDANNDGSAGGGERIAWRPLEDNVRFERPPAGLNGPVSSALAGSGLRQVNGMPSLTFRRNGSTSGDIEIYLSAQGKSGKEWRAVTVAQATGRSEWFKRVNNIWRAGAM